MKITRLAALIVSFILGCATAPKRPPARLPIPAHTEIVGPCDPSVWLGFVAVEVGTLPGEIPGIVAMLSPESSFDPETGRTRIMAKCGAKLAGAKQGDYWQFLPPENPKLTEIRVYEDGRVLGVSEDEGPDCRVFFRGTGAQSPDSPGKEIVIKTQGIYGKLLRFVPLTFDHTEGACRESPRRRPSKPQRVRDSFPA